MATLVELRDFFDNSALRNKVEAACVVKAASILTTGTPSAAQIAYAKGVLGDPYAAAQAVWRYVIGANSGATSAQISGASDSTIQTAVNTAMDLFKGS